MDASERDEIEAALAALNQRVLDSHEAFAPVLESLKQTVNLVPLGGKDSVSIEAVPAKVFDMLSRAQVLLSGKTGARLPIGRHGEGTQSLAVICLFGAFLGAKLADGYSPQAEPILALEEPEAHIHPSAVRAVGSLLSGLPGQKIIAAHSGDLLATVPLIAIRRLSRSGSGIKVHQVKPGALTPEEIRKLDHHVRLTRGSLLFARFWLFIEGETEVLLFEECARIMGHDLFAEGICCVEFTAVGIERFIKLADQLGIDWLVMADKDPAGDGFVRSATRQLNGRAAANHIQQLPSGAVEAYLCAAGFGDIYEANISPQKAAIIVAAKGTEEYWDQVIRLRMTAKKSRR
jgi:putative ATP-dependent endonuclease of OLD family